jgi:hypothetical protein
MVTMAEFASLRERLLRSPKIVVFVDKRTLAWKGNLGVQLLGELVRQRYHLIAETEEGYLYRLIPKT